jgi:hypothetical protein
VVELDRLELDRPGLEGLDEVEERGADPGRRTQVVDHHALLHARQLFQHLRHLVLAVVFLAAIEVAVRAEEHLRLDLAEAIQHALHAEIRRAARPDRAQARGREQRRGAFGHVGQVPRHAVALLHARIRKRLRDPGDQVVELPLRELPLDAVFAAENDRRALAALAQQVLRVIEPRFGKPLRSGHPVRIEQRRPAALAQHGAEIPDPVPEGRRILHRPAVQLVEAPLPGELHEAGELGAGRPLGGRGPQGLRHCRLFMRASRGCPRGCAPASASPCR